MVECHLAKVDVASPNLVYRSNEPVLKRAGSFFMLLSLFCFSKSKDIFLISIETASTQLFAGCFFVFRKLSRENGVWREKCKSEWPSVVNVKCDIIMINR